MNNDVNSTQVVVSPTDYKLMLTEALAVLGRDKEEANKDLEEARKYEKEKAEEYTSLCERAFKAGVLHDEVEVATDDGTYTEVKKGWFSKKRIVIKKRPVTTEKVNLWKEGSIEFEGLTISTNLTKKSWEGGFYHRPYSRKDDTVEWEICCYKRGCMYPHHPDTMVKREDVPKMWCEVTGKEYLKKWSCRSGGTEIRLTSDFYIFILDNQYEYGVSNCSSRLEVLGEDINKLQSYMKMCVANVSELYVAKEEFLFVRGIIDEGLQCKI